jgi:hypothetical protein
MMDFGTKGLQIVIQVSVGSDSITLLQLDM